jgi:6-phosphogluconate dehydrogenase
MSANDIDIGVIGLGVMGHNLALNIADHGFSVVGYDKDSSKVQALADEGGTTGVLGADDVQTFLNMLKVPRSMIILVPAGAPVDAVIEDLLPYLEDGDLVIDGGNSHYIDTDRRADRLASKGIHYFGMGISGGEEGARYGPSMMPGGDEEAYSRVKPILEAAAAKVDDDPCVTYLGPRSAGHYVKMVHNGIEYGLMQLIAESYDLMKRGLKMENPAIAEVFADWSEGQLHGYLIEITADIFREPDDQGEGWLIDKILDAARQKGTGMWTAQSAMDLQVPTPVIDNAVGMRNLSSEKETRLAVARIFEKAEYELGVDRTTFLDHLEHALYAAMIVTYAQGMELLRSASNEYQYDLRLADVARIWRGGCIIRSNLLEPIRSAYDADPTLESILLDDHLGAEAYGRMNILRQVVTSAVNAGIPVPGFSSALAYLESLRSAWLPANLIQAQRDDFGAHRYERTDRKGTFHTQWSSRKVLG